MINGGDLMKRKITALALSSVIAASGLSLVSAPASAEWVKSGSSYSYTDGGKKLTGWQEIDGGRYYFDKSGKALTGWYRISGDKYYFNAAKKGRMSTLWVKIGSSYYYFGSDGVMRTGWVKLDGKTYYFGSDGVMRTGTVKIDGKAYRFGTDGVLAGKVASASKSGSVSWNDSIADVEEMLENKDIEYVTMGSAILSGDFEGMNITYYLFDDDDVLGVYGNMYEGTDTGSAGNKLKNAGYKFYGKVDAGGSDVYFYRNKLNNLAFVTSYESDGKHFVMSMYCSPKLSKQIEKGDTSDFADILGSIG